MSIERIVVTIGGRREIREVDAPLFPDHPEHGRVKYIAREADGFFVKGDQNGSMFYATRHVDPDSIVETSDG